jgi:hypothetical protein
MKNPTESSTLVGRALYLELRNEPHNSTFQFLLTPPVRMPNNPSTFVRPVLYRRQLTRIQPKRVWKTMHPSPAEFDDSATLEQRLHFIKNVLERLGNAKFKVFGEPIIVDVSLEDMQAIQLFRTPYKLIGRIERVRRAKGFPKEYLPKS